MSFRAISTEDKSQWIDTLSKVKTYDFYHTCDYHKLSFENNEGDPRLCIYETSNEIIIFPILLRSIVINNNDTGLKDFTSAYGYVGPLYSADVSKEAVVNFVESFKNYCLENNIISGFSRVHPLIESDFILSSLGSINQNNATVTIDLNQTLEEQRRAYRKSNKSEINQLRKKANVIWSSKSEKDIDIFIEIYNENMRRVNAKDYYFFDKQYYNNFFNSTDFRSELLFIEIDNRIAAAAIFVFTDNIIQYHLAGTSEDFLRMAPVKLLIDEIRIYGTENNFKFFHLGGGTSNSADDPLFRFKKGFSKSTVDFKLFKSIFNDTEYTRLSALVELSAKDYNKNFFPLYRNI